MKVVITGGAGFIGSNLAKALQEKHEILIIDKMQSEERFKNGNLKCLGHFKNLLDFKGELFIACINDPRTLSVIDEFSPDVIFHEAAISDTTAWNQNEVLSINLNTFKSLIEIAREQDAKLIYASSASVYGSLKAPQAVGVESPLNPYAFSKLMMDRLALKYKSELDIIGLRYFNVYGPGEYFKGKTASMIMQFGIQLLEGKTPALFEGSDEILRDFVYIKDVVEANLAALKAKSGVYNVGFGKAHSFASMLKFVQDELGINKEPIYIKNPFTKAYQFHTQASLDPSFAFKPQWDLKDGVKDMSSYIREIFKSEVRV